MNRNCSKPRIEPPIRAAKRLRPMSHPKRPGSRHRSLAVPSGDPASVTGDAGHTAELPMFLPQVIVSGGQTGVDRAALDIAMERGIPHGGWCPRGRLAEDGQVPLHYGLQETDSSEYRVRTERNVIDSSATLVLYSAKISGGTRLTLKFAREHRRPWLSIDLSRTDWAAELNRARMWLNDCRPTVLNVAGPRESSVAGVGGRAAGFLRELFGPMPAAGGRADRKTGPR